MAGIRYTVEQLEHLRESPLVKKPDALPSIEQWMDVPNEQNSNNATASNAGSSRRPRTNLREGETASAGEHRAERPLLGAMGQFGRRSSTRKSTQLNKVLLSLLSADTPRDHGDEAALGGPPKLNFASATRARPGQSKEPTGITSTDGEHPGDRFPRNDRWRDGDRPREKGFANGGRRAAREEGEGWQNVKGRKSLGQEDFDRGFGRNGDRERKDGEPENGDAPPRRAGNRWGRREDNAKDTEGTKFSATTSGGWRDRDRNREREREREWTRGAKEEDPEWMDTPVPKKEVKAHTQEDFQRWKEQMKAKDAPVEEKEESKVEPGFADGILPSGGAAIHPQSKPAGTPSALEPNLGNMFGNWGKEKSADTSVSEPVTAKAKPDKKSRFMTMFAKSEESSGPAQPLASGPASPGVAPESNADREGFERILQMLVGANVGTPTAQPSAPPSSTLRQGGIPLEFQHQASPPEIQERRVPNQPPPSLFDQQALLENILAPRPTGPENRPSQQGRFSAMSPDNTMLEQFGLPRPDSSRPVEEYALQQPPSRNNNPQDANLAALLNSRTPTTTNTDSRDGRNKDFLLHLMQQPRATPPQLVSHNLPRQPAESQNAPFFDHARQPPQGQVKGRGGLPPNFMDERMFLEQDMMRREAERREIERREQLARELQQQEAMRNNKNRGFPAGFPGHEDAALAGLQRRNTAGEIPRQLTNMGIPSQPPELQYMGGRQPGMPPTPQEGPSIRPPPGFNGPVRQPPGLAGPVPGPGLQQPMGPVPSFSAGNTPMGPPPGFHPSNNMRSGMFPGGMGGPGGPGGPGGNGMQGPPQGYFPPPPNYGPPMGMRNDDPRMMFEQQFGGPGPRQQGRPGPPNMY